MTGGKVWARVVAVLAMCGAGDAFAAPCEPLRAPLIFCSDFESGVLGENGQVWNVSGNSPTVSTDVARSGRYSMKTVLNRATSKDWFRTEVSSGTGRVNIVPNGEYWYGFSIYLPASYVKDNLWEFVAQWHNIPDKNKGEATDLNPPLSLGTQNGVWSINTIWDSRVLTEKKTYEGKKMYQLGAYNTGKWTDFVFHVRWSPNSNGFLQVWKDGVKVIDASGGIAFNDAVGPYLKMGIYKGWTTRTTPAGNVSVRTLYHDEVRIADSGGSYAAVSPGGAPSSAPAPDQKKPNPPGGVSIDPSH
ncbi:MAG: polysaccharide lyase [Gammaproteobacteria bacterium]